MEFSYLGYPPITDDSTTGARQDKYEPLYSEGSPHENGEDHAGETDRTTVAGTLVIAPRSIEEVHLVS